MYLLLQMLVLKEWCCQRVLHHCWHQRQGFRQTHFRQHLQTQTCVSMRILQHNEYLTEILSNEKKVIATRNNCSLGIWTTKPLNPIHCSQTMPLDSFTPYLHPQDQWPCRHVFQNLWTSQFTMAFTLERTSKETSWFKVSVWATLQCSRFPARVGTKPLEHINLYTSTIS